MAGGAGTFPKWSARQEVRPSYSRICWQEYKGLGAFDNVGELMSATITDANADFYWRDDNGANDGATGYDFCKAIGDAMTAASAIGDGATNFCIGNRKLQRRIVSCGTVVGHWRIQSASSIT